MSKYQKFEPSVAALKRTDFAQWLYIASACRLWLRESRAIRRRRRENKLRRDRVSSWDWSSSTAVMR